MVDMGLSDVDYKAVCRIPASSRGARVLGGVTEAAIWLSLRGGAGAAGMVLDPAWLRVTQPAMPCGGRRRARLSDWVPGRLWIGGLGVAEGYRDDPLGSAEKFVRSPLVSHQ